MTYFVLSYGVKPQLSQSINLILFKFRGGYSVMFYKYLLAEVCRQFLPSVNTYFCMQKQDTCTFLSGFSSGDVVAKAVNCVVDF